MPKHSNLYTIGFVATVALVTSLLLSTASMVLRNRQQANIALDMKKNILKSFGALPTPADRGVVDSLYSSSVEAVVVNSRGQMVAGDPDDIHPEREEKEKPNVEDRLYPLYIFRQDGAIVAYTIPIIGKGLWSSLYGYLSLNADGETVRGITFYQHGETPGLGAEIAENWFQANFVGKKVVDAKGNLTSVTVVKGKASDLFDEPELSHYVDGISGATITCNGVTRMLQKWLEAYQPYFQSIRLKGHNA